MTKSVFSRATAFACWLFVSALVVGPMDVVRSDDGVKARAPQPNATKAANKKTDAASTPSASASDSKSANSKTADSKSADSKSTDKRAVDGKNSSAAKPTDKTDKAADKSFSSAAKPAAKDEQKFVRTLMGDNGKPNMLQTAIVTYQSKSGKFTGAKVDLIGAIHIADKAYFKKLNTLFKNYDALLYEMVADPETVKQVRADSEDRSAVSAVQSGMKDLLGLSFQLDEIDYQAKNFVHADMSPEEFTQSLTQRQEGLMQFVMRSIGSSLALQGAGKSNDLEMINAFFSTNRELALKRVLAAQIEEMDGQLAAISGDDGKSTLITERNNKALEVLKRELEAGKKKLGIFYGAGHFRHMAEQLEQEFDLHPVKTQWLDAWNMK